MYGIYFVSLFTLLLDSGCVLHSYHADREAWSLQALSTPAHPGVGAAMEPRHEKNKRIRWCGLDTAAAPSTVDAELCKQERAGTQSNAHGTDDKKSGTTFAAVRSLSYRAGRMRAVLGACTAGTVWPHMWTLTTTDLARVQTCAGPAQKLLAMILAKWERHFHFHEMVQAHNVHMRFALGTSVPLFRFKCS